MDVENDSTDRIGLRVTAFSAMGEIRNNYLFWNYHHNNSMFWMLLLSILQVRGATWRIALVSLIRSLTMEKIWIMLSLGCLMGEWCQQAISFWLNVIKRCCFATSFESLFLRHIVIKKFIFIGTVATQLRFLPKIISWTISSTSQDSGPPTTKICCKR